MLYWNDKIWIQFGLFNIKISSRTYSPSIWTKMHSRGYSVKNWLLHGVFYPTSARTDRKCFLIQNWNLYPFCFSWHGFSMGSSHKVWQKSSLMQVINSWAPQEPGLKIFSSLFPTWPLVLKSIFMCELGLGSDMCFQRKDSSARPLNITELSDSIWKNSVVLW